MSNSYPLPDLQCSPPTNPIGDSTDVAAAVAYFKIALSHLTREHFLNDAIWRDSFAMTGTLRTFYSAASILAAWDVILKTHQPTEFSITGDAKVFRAPWGQWLNIGFKFSTRGIPETECSGSLSVTPEENGEWKIWMMTTVLERLIGQPNVDVLNPVDNTANGSNVHGPLATTNPIHRTIPEAPSQHFECVVVGGGQSGLSVGGSLKALGVSYVILEKHPEIGDNWKTRYNSLKCTIPLSVYVIPQV
jgi:hypothetical protein